MLVGRVWICEEEEDWDWDGEGGKRRGGRSMGGREVRREREMWHVSRGGGW